MTKEDIQIIVAKILREEGFGFEDGFDETLSLEDLGLDSLDTLCFISCCEEKFHLNNLDEEGILTTSTLHSIIEIIYNKKN